jgi:hypothetical protein
LACCSFFLVPTIDALTELLEKEGLNGV